MFLISWNIDDEQYRVIAANKSSAWQIYWLVRQNLKTMNISKTSWMKIIDEKGIILDPSFGEYLPEKENTDPLILKRV